MPAASAAANRIFSMVNITLAPDRIVRGQLAALAIEDFSLSRHLGFADGAILCKSLRYESAGAAHSATLKDFERIPTVLLRVVLSEIGGQCTRSDPRCGIFFITCPLGKLPCSVDIFSYRDRSKGIQTGRAISVAERP